MRGVPIRSGIGPVLVIHLVGPQVAARIPELALAGVADQHRTAHGVRDRIARPRTRMRGPVHAGMTGPVLGHSSAYGCGASTVADPHQQYGAPASPRLLPG